MLAAGRLVGVGGLVAVVDGNLTSGSPGRTVWRGDPAIGPVVDLAAVGGRVVAAGRNAGVAALGSDGERRWRLGVGRGVNRVRLEVGPRSRLYAVDTGGVTRVGENGASLQWRREDGAVADADAHDGGLDVGLGSRVSAVTPAGGRRWASPSLGEGSVGRVVRAGGYSVATVETESLGPVVGVDPDAGTVRWRASADGTGLLVDAGPVVVTRGPTGDGTAREVVGRDPATGVSRWSYAVDRLEHVAATDESVCVVGAADGPGASTPVAEGTVAVVEAETGRERWRTDLVATRPRVRPAPDGGCWVTAPNRDLVLRYDGQGERAWEARVDGLSPVAAPVAAGGLTCVSTAEGVAAVAER